MAEAHTNNGGYQLQDIVWHQHSNILMVEILKLFPKHIPISDLGCGHNWYVGVLAAFGYKAFGIDIIDINQSQLFFKRDITELWDLSNIKPTNVISLEVGEHIPFKLSHTYLDNLCKHKGEILLSWAIPGQPGIGHINCQTNDWVCTEMLKRGYMIDDEITMRLRDAVKTCHCSWFQNTLMYFKPCE